MKKTPLLILVFALVFGGCLPEGDDGCDDNIKLSFYLEDDYEAGDFDSRIANDVILYLFSDNRFVSKHQIPYDQISGGNKYVLQKSRSVNEKIDMIAWAVPSDGGNPTYIPDWTRSTILDGVYLELTRATRGGIACNPALCNLYLGVLSLDEIKPDEERTITMLHSSCRIEVNITDNLDNFLRPDSDPRIELRGTMNKMDMNFAGCGEKAVVHTLLKSRDTAQKLFCTGRFGVMPSAEGETLSVKIYNGNNLLATLDVPENSPEYGAKAGGLIIFDYELGKTEFWLTVNDYREKVIIKDGM